jgi:hypothetical protein
LKLARRKLALSWARKAGWYGITMAEWIVLAHDVWNVVGPYVVPGARKRASLTSNSPRVAARQANAVLGRAAPRKLPRKRLAFRRAMKGFRKKS